MKEILAVLAAFSIPIACAAVSLTGLAIHMISYTSYTKEDVMAREWRDIPQERKVTPKGVRVGLTIAAIGLAFVIGCQTGWIFHAKPSVTKNNETAVQAMAVSDKAAPMEQKAPEVKKTSKPQVKPETDIPEDPTEPETEIVEEAVEVTVEPVEAAKDEEYVEAQAEEWTGETDIPDDEWTDGTYYSADQFMSNGEVYDDEWRYTWYSQNVLPGGGLDIPGRHVEDGYVVDEDGYVVLASQDLEMGTTVDIPVGNGVGKVYDWCDVPGTLDVYTDF